MLWRNFLTLCLIASWGHPWLSFGQGNHSWVGSDGLILSIQKFLSYHKKWFFSRFLGENIFLHNFIVIFHQEEKYSNYLLNKSWNTPNFYFLAKNLPFLKTIYLIHNWGNACILECVIPIMQWENCSTVNWFFLF